MTVIVIINNNFIHLSFIVYTTSIQPFVEPFVSIYLLFSNNPYIAYVHAIFDNSSLKERCLCSLFDMISHAKLIIVNGPL